MKNQAFHLSKAVNFKGKVQTNFKSTHKVWKKVWKNCNMSKYYCGIVGGGPPPRCNIFWQILHTFCLLFNLFWTFPLKSIGFLRFQLIFRWFFNDFSGFSADFLDILQGLCGRLKKNIKSHENPRFPLPLQIKDSWDHAQMIERKILCRIALTRALYDQIRP